MTTGALENLTELGLADPQRVRAGGEALLRLTSSTVAAARRFFAVALVGAAANALTVTLLLAYVLHTRVATLPTALLVAAGVALPGAALALYAWLFRLATRLPECVNTFVGDFNAALARFQRADPAASAAAGSSGEPPRSWPQRMESLVRVGRLALDVYRAVRQQPDVQGVGPLRAVAMMVLPPFWLVFAAALGSAIVLLVVVPLACLALHLLR
jgi:hypothetical protein